MDNYANLLAETISLHKKGKLELSLKDETQTRGFITMQVSTISFLPFLPRNIKQIIRKHNSIYTGKLRARPFPISNTSIESGTTA